MKHATITQLKQLDRDGKERDPGMQDPAGSGHTLLSSGLALSALAQGPGPWKAQSCRWPISQVITDVILSENRPCAFTVMSLAEEFGYPAAA